MSPPDSRVALRAAWTVAILLGIANGYLLWNRQKPVVPPPVPERSAPARAVRFRLQPPEGVTLALGRGSSVAVSPDGTQVAFRAESNGAAQLYLQLLDRFEAQPINGTNGGIDPFFSPDGRWIGFFADEKLKKILTEGGLAVTLADAANPRGSTWADDDHIYLAPRNNTGIWRVPAGGGKIAPVTTPSDGQLSHRWPQMAPGAKALVYTIWNDTGWGTGRIVWQPLDGTAGHVIASGGGFGRIVEHGDGNVSLVYANGHSLVAAPFDLARASASGAARVVVDAVYVNNSGGAQLDVAGNGSLAHVSGESGSPSRDMTWVGKDGHTTTAGALSGVTHLPALSPDASTLAFYKEENGTRDVWLYHMRTREVVRLSSHLDSTAIEAPMMTVPPAIAWSPDGAELAYVAGTPTNLYRVAMNRPGVAERLTTTLSAQTPTSWAPDGRTLAFVELDSLSGRDIWLLSQDGNRRWVARPFLQTPFNETSPEISPNGRWIAYTSNETGRFETYVQPFPSGGRRVQISNGGGAFPHWSPSGTELFFVSGSGDRGLMVARLEEDAAVATGSLRQLFETRGYDPGYGVARDGRMLMTTLSSALGPPRGVTVVLNWGAELANRPTVP